MTERSLWHRVRDSAFLRLSLVTRGMTLGVRGAVFDADERVLLVRHSYTPGWHFPGGGVDAGETFYDALKRELDEEAGIALTEDAPLHGLFQNRKVSVRDHVAVYVVRSWRRLREVTPNFEIVETRFAPLSDLPADTTPGTRRRLDEIVGGAPSIPYWS